MIRILAAVLLGAVMSGVTTGTPSQAHEPVKLFDGKTLQGWKVITCEAEVVEKEAAILLKAGNGLVELEKQYGDFVIEFEWKALKEDAWDSGLYFRYTEIPPKRPWPNKYQVNLRKGMEGDLVGFPKGKNTVPLKKGDWNHFALTVKGSQAAMKVNGKQAWKVDGIEVPKGSIALQAEIPGGGQFLFRNITIHELDD